LDRLPHFVSEPIERGVDPPFEAWKVGVALGEQAMVLHQGTEVLRLFARYRVEALVCHGCGAVAEPAQQTLDLGGAFPDQDRLWSIRGAECVDKTRQCRVGWLAAEEPVEIVAEGAADADSAAVVSCFDVAALAVEVPGDLGAG